MPWGTTSQDMGRPSPPEGGVEDFDVHPKGRGAAINIGQIGHNLEDFFS